MTVPFPLAARAREFGLALRVGPGSFGYADVASLLVSGPDAGTYLHAQTTNEVSALAPGQGNWGARVERTGHLVAAFSIHRLPDADGASRFLLLLPREDLDRLQGALDDFLFADDVTIRVDPTLSDAALVQGPGALALFAEPVGRTLVEGEVVRLDGGWLVARSLTGDPGLIFVGPADGATAVVERARSAGFVVDDPEPSARALDALRIEAGLVRPTIDLVKRRLLPETGLEQHAVSYTKGCYLGQEVIARVRTYGSVPFALRALVFHGAALPDLPGCGEPLLSEDGSRVGQAASAADSPVAGAPVLLAFLGRAHRTPDQSLTLRTSAGLRTATVVLLPLHHAADRAARVEGLYDRGVRTFAAGDAEAALDLLEQAIRLDPSFGDAYEAIGVMLGRAQRYHEAIDFFRRLEEVVPEEPLVNTNLSLYYMRLGDKTTAEEQSAVAARKAMAHGSGESRSAADIARNADRARRDDAARKERMFKQVLDFDPVDPVALFGLGTALLTLERFDEAAQTLAQAVQVDKKNSAIYPALGRAYEHLDDDDQARQAYRAGIEVASRRGDLMPLKEMQARLMLLGG